MELEIAVGLEGHRANELRNDEREGAFSEAHTVEHESEQPRR